MSIELFTTIPELNESDRQSFLLDLKRVATQSEKYGFKGILIYSDNRHADPWMIASLILSSTTALLPMISLQPFHMHPFSVARKISSIALIYGRRIALNLMAGGVMSDLKALGDLTENSKRYDKLQEFTEIIQQLFSSSEPVNYEGKYYQIKNLKLKPDIPENLKPLFYMSGSSDSAKNTAANLGVPIIQYPEPGETYSNTPMNDYDAIKGIRIGILARHSHKKAWLEARKRFPDTNDDELMHYLENQSPGFENPNKSSNPDNYSSGNGQDKEPVYWIEPFEQFKAFCPYLVGDYDEVAKELSAYLIAGCKTCIIDSPVSEIELESTYQVFNRAQIHTQTQDHTHLQNQVAKAVI